MTGDIISMNLLTIIINHNIIFINITRDIFYVRRAVDLLQTANVNTYITYILGKIELLSVHAN